VYDWIISVHKNSNVLLTLIGDDVKVYQIIDIYTIYVIALFLRIIIDLYRP